MLSHVEHQEFSVKLFLEEDRQKTNSKTNFFLVRVVPGTGTPLDLVLL